MALFVLVIACGTIKAKCFPEESKIPEDTNVYLGEEVIFGKDYSIKIIGISLDKEEEQENTKDEDGDKLSSYVLNLKIKIKQVSKKV